MCKYCEGKKLLRLDVDIAKPVVYGGGLYREERTYNVKIIDDKLAIGTYPKGYKHDTDDSIKIKFCPMCGIELSNKQ